MKKIFCLVFLFINIQVNSQNLIELNNTKQAIKINYGIEPTYVFGLQYRYAKEFTEKFKIVSFVESNSPIRIFGLKNYEAKMGIYIPYLFINNCGILYEGNISTGHVETKNFNSQKIAFLNRIYFGIYKEKWHFHFGLAHEHIYANKIKHSNYYREFIYNDAKDGWYKGAGGNFQLGIEYGYVFKQKFETAIEFKIPKSEKWNSYYGSPAHINLNFGIRI